MEFDNNNNNNNISNDLFETQRFKHNRNKIKKRVQEGFISNFFNASIIEGNQNQNSDSELTKKRKTTLKTGFSQFSDNDKLENKNLREAQTYEPAFEHLLKNCKGTNVGGKPVDGHLFWLRGKEGYVGAYSSEGGKKILFDQLSKFFIDN